MKTLDQIKELYKSAAIDGRDLGRLCQFIPFEMFPFCGMELKPEVTKEDFGEVKEFTKENILFQLEKDVAFGFEKALNKRGLSSSMMAEVVKMWNWILEEGLEDFDDYAMYGLPIFKATALKYGFDNPIGEDSGLEEEYNEH
jgi:hypothetical protein